MLNEKVKNTDEDFEMTTNDTYSSGLTTTIRNNAAHVGHLNKVVEVLWSSDFPSCPAKFFAACRSRSCFVFQHDKNIIRACSAQ